MKYSTVTIILVSAIGNVSGLQNPSVVPSRSTSRTFFASGITSESQGTTCGNPGRRQILKSTCSLLLAPFVVTAVSSPAFADVSDGNALPEGAAQFGRILRAKSDMLAVQKRVTENASDMDKTEWNNVGQFLRRVYATSEDMKSIAAGFYDPEKKKKASVLIDNLKKLSKAADEPTGSQNGPAFTAYSKKIVSTYDDFLELLQDVPDEL